LLRSVDAVINDYLMIVQCSAVWCILNCALSLVTNDFTKFKLLFVHSTVALNFIGCF